jgi:hypothetical protein
MLQEIAARFKVSTTMNIVGIGYIVAGEIINGHVDIGYTIRFDITNVYRIDAVEAIDYVSAQYSETALILEPLDDSSAANLLSLNSGQIVQITSNKEA